MHDWKQLKITYFFYIFLCYFFVVSDIVLPLANRDCEQPLEQIGEREQVVVSRVVDILNKRLTRSSRNNKEVTNYDKYRSLMFGKDDDEMNDQDPDESPTHNKAPKASQERRKWSKEEDTEILYNMDFSSASQPTSKHAARLLALSKSKNGPIFKGKRTRSSLQNKLIRMWKKHQRT